MYITTRIEGPLPVLPVTISNIGSGRKDWRRRLIFGNSAMPPLCINYNFINEAARKKRYDSYHELSELERMAVVQRQCSSSSGTNMGTVNILKKIGQSPSKSTHNTNGDLIFSASRVRFTLFQAYTIDQREVGTIETLYTHRSHRSKYAWLVSKLFVVITVIPPCSS